MAMEFFNPLDYKQQPGVAFVWENLASNPSSVGAGYTYFNTTNSSFMGFNGSTWINLGYFGVDAASIATANGFLGDSSYDGLGGVSLEIKCSVSGLLKGDGTGVSAATAADVPTPLTTKGDLFTYGTGGTRLGVGSNQTVLTANSAQTTGLQWVTLNASYISDFDTQVRTSRLDQMAAPTADLSINSQKLTNVADGTAGTDVVTVGQMSDAFHKLPVKESVVTVARTPGTLATDFDNGKLVDGQTLVTGDRILLIAQTSTHENGIYVVNASGAPTRAPDCNSTGDLFGGLRVFVSGSNSESKFSYFHCLYTDNVPWVPGSDGSTWTGSYHVEGTVTADGYFLGLGKSLSWTSFLSTTAWTIAANGTWFAIAGGASGAVLDGTDTFTISASTGEVRISGQLDNAGNALSFGDYAGIRAYDTGKAGYALELYADTDLYLQCVDSVVNVVSLFSTGPISGGSGAYITGPVIATSGIGTATEVNKGTVGASVTINWANGCNQRLTLTTGTTCTITLSNPGAIGWYTLKTISPSSGTVPSVNWPANLRWASGTKPSQASTLGRANIQRIYWDGTNYWADAIINAG